MQNIFDNVLKNLVNYIYTDEIIKEENILLLNNSQILFFISFFTKDLNSINIDIISEENKLIIYTAPEDEILELLINYIDNKYSTKNKIQYILNILQDLYNVKNMTNIKKRKK